MIRSMLATLLILVGVLAAPAAAQYEPGPTVSVSPTVAVAGASVTLTGQQCPAGVPVTISAPGLEPQTTTAAADGTWSGVVAVPSGTTGTWTLTVSCGTAVMVASVQIGAAAEAVPTAAPLPVTGGQTVPSAVLGVGLVAGGLLLVALSRRRQAQS